MARLQLLLFCVLLSNLLAAQQSDQDKLRDAKVFFSHERYSEALSIIANSRTLSRSNDEARFLMAVCQYQTNALDAAFRTLTSLTQNEKPPYPECWLYLAKIYHAQHRFQEASNYYKTYLRSIYPNDPNRRMVVEEIRRCANGIELQYQASTVVTENLGPEINTAGDEFAPISSPNHADRLYFSAIRPQNTGGPRDAYGNPDLRWGNYFSDLFSTQVVKGRWSNVAPMHYLLNSPRHEVLLGFGEDGKTLFYFKGWDLQRGEIVVDTFKRVEERTLSSTPLPAPIDLYQGDNHPVFYRDTLVIFASTRPGGYGGWDLYKSVKRRGVWTAAQNLGPTVNSAFDETTPFLANDGQTLYFSSNNSGKSIGGLDVFKTIFIPQKNLWLPPKNVGIPINSSGDDVFFKISRDGFTAFFASSRKDGYGKRDIYAAFFQDFLPEMEFPANYHARVNPDQPPPRTISLNESKETDPYSGNQAAPTFQPPSSTDFDTPPVRPQPENVPPEPPVRPAPTPPATPETPSTPSSVYAPVLIEGNTVSPTQHDLIDRLAAALNRRRDLRLVLTAFHPKDGATGVDLFRAIEKAEAVAEYLQAKGVADQQLFMRGTLIDSNDPRINRVEIAFSTAAGDAPANDLPSLGSGRPGSSSGLAINEPLHYKIQVASAKRPVEDGYLEGYSAPMIEKTPDFAYYRYTLGVFTDRDAAESFRQKMKANGRTSAFLATYKLGWRTAR